MAAIPEAGRVEAGLWPPSLKLAAPSPDYGRHP